MSDGTLGQTSHPASEGVDWQKIANELEDERERLAAMVARVEAVVEVWHPDDWYAQLIRSALSDPTNGADARMHPRLPSFTQSQARSLAEHQTEPVFERHPKSTRVVGTVEP